MANLTDTGYGVGKYLEVFDGSGVPGIAANRKNLDALNFYLASNNAYAVYSFVDGMVDAYTSEAGVDIGTSTNETYDSKNDLYSPTGGNTNMTLVSIVQAAQAAPDEGRLMLYEEDVDSITLDTDLKGYVSRDNGTTYTQTLLSVDSTITHPTSLLLHCDGSNDGVVFTDSSYWEFVPTVNGNTHTDTAIKKFGTASAQFDGTGDSLTYTTLEASAGTSSDRWDFGSGDFTIDCWVNRNNDTGRVGLIGNWTSGSAPFSGGWGLEFNASNFIDFYWDYGANYHQLLGSTAVTGTGWHHIAIVRNGTNWQAYLNGTSEDSETYSDTIDTTTNDLSIGNVDGGGYFTGYMDEIRITKGLARWTGNFTAPSAAYSGTEGDTRMVSGSVDISGQPSGTNMKYKIETLNSKDLKLHGTSMLWA